MIPSFDPDISTEQYKDLLDLWSNEAVQLEFRIKDSNISPETKQMFNEFIHAHRQMVIAEAHWYASLVRDVQTQPEKKPFYKRFRQK